MTLRQFLRLLASEIVCVRRIWAERQLEQAGNARTPINTAMMEANDKWERIQEEQW